MSDALASLLVVSLVVLGGLLGCRVGAGSIVSRGGPIVLGWTAGAIATIAAFKAHWFQPLGLVNPFVVGLAVGSVVPMASRRLLGSLVRATRAGLSPVTTAVVQRILGSFLGALGGLGIAIALGWAVLLARGGATGAGPRPGEEGAPPTGVSAAFALLRAANHGFVRHLPVVGEVGDEMEAVAFILSVDREVRARLAEDEGWKHIAGLPTFRSIVDDECILEDIAGVGKGRLSSIYRLQRHPKIIAFFEEPAVQSILAESRPSILAKKLEKLRGSRAPESRSR